MEKCLYLKIKVNKNGFTLIEMLVVLSVLSIIILLAVPLQFSSLTKQEENQFIELFMHDVLLIQNQASMNSTESMFIRFHDDHYLIIQRRKQPFAKRNYPNGWSFVGANRLLEFSESGSVLNPRVILMYSKEERIAFTFPLGKGRFYVERDKRVLAN